MKAIQCDKCKKYMVGKHTEINIYQYSDPTKYQYSTYDLCSECNVKLLQYFNDTGPGSATVLHPHNIRF